eukprot:SAG22_NODE_359_length_11758_cov_4.094254_16_plen_125_part_00
MDTCTRSLPGDFNGSYGIQFDCINALGQGGGGGRMSCVVCSDDQPCLFDVLADPGETKNLAKAMPALAASMKTTLDSYLPYVPALTPANLVGVRQWQCQRTALIHVHVHVRVCLAHVFLCPSAS